nr:uncharacterized protein LOC100182678 [Ciona intestinalis]|eukprot:XP_018666971.1 uncharacterized protein LOC100182678 [Ciona intestinalis]
MKNQQSLTASLPSHATDAKPFGASSRCNNSSSTDESSAHIWNEIHDEEYPKYSKESYTSYIAEVYPTGWSMKFNTRRKLVQRVLFTNWLNVKLNGDLKLTSYQVLLVMHRESIGLYNVVIEDMQYGKMKTSQGSLLLEQPSRTRVFGKPTSEVLSSHAIWNQWEPHTQRLWYMVPITNKSLEKHQKLSSEEIAGLPTKCNIVCLQFYETVPHQKVLEVQLCLHLSRFALYNTSSLNRHYDLDPTVSSIELNMRVVTMCESGLTCVCWQEKQSKHNVGNRLYSIAILNKDILIHHPYQEDIGDVPISFYPLGSMLIVQAAGKFLHIYDTNAISCNEIRMQSGLFHLLLSGDLLPPIANHHLEYIKRHYRPVADSESDPNHYSDSQESILSSVGSYDCATICFDLTRRCFLSLELCSQAFCELFTSDRTTTKNKVYMTRQAVLYPQGCNASSNLLSIVLQTIITFPAQHYITPMLCQLLTAMACAELADYKHAIPTTMIPLLPSSLSSYALNWLLTEKELSQDDVVYESMYGTCENLCSSVKQYIAALSSDHKLTAIDRVVGKSDTQIMDSNKSTVWYRVFSACEQGLYTEYDLDSIRDELTILKRLKKDKDEKSTNILDNLPSRLMDLFHKRFGKPLSSSVDSMLDLEDDYQTTTMLSFLDKHERIETSDYIMVLTTEKLEDHFSAHIPASSDPTSSLKLSRISRDYVSAQMRAVHHVLTLLMLKSGVEDPQSRL